MQKSKPCDSSGCRIKMLHELEIVQEAKNLRFKKMHSKKMLTRQAKTPK